MGFDFRFRGGEEYMYIARCGVMTLYAVGILFCNVYFFYSVLILSLSLSL